MSAPQPAQFAGIAADHEQITEAGVGTCTRIPREVVRSVELARASPVKHPLLMFVFGLVFVAGGLYGLRRIITWFLVGGVISELHVGLVAFLALGAYALYESALKRVPVLLVRTTRGTRKLVFLGPVTREGILQFLRRLDTEFGYTIHGDLHGSN
jgi:hypothetical protein